MSQIKKNKADVFETMVRIAHEPMDIRDARNLGALYGAYNALCLVEREEHPEDHEHHEETTRTHQRTAQMA